MMKFFNQLLIVDKFTVLIVSFGFQQNLIRLSPYHSLQLVSPTGHDRIWHRITPECIGLPIKTDWNLTEFRRKFIQYVLISQGFHTRFIKSSQDIASPHNVFMKILQDFIKVLYGFDRIFVRFHPDPIKTSQDF